MFSTHDGGQSWQQKSAGLGGRDVFTLQQTANGALIAGTNRGMFLLDRNATQWRPINNIVTEKTPARREGKREREERDEDSQDTRGYGAIRSGLARERYRGHTQALARGYRAGLFTSTDQGKTWTGGPVLGKTDFVSVESEGDLIVAATRTNVLYSTTGGTIGSRHRCPRTLPAFAA